MAKDKMVHVIRWATPEGDGGLLGHATEAEARQDVRILNVTGAAEYLGEFTENEFEGLEQKLGSFGA